MAKRTKKVGPAGRLGARYGVRIRKRIADIEVQSKGRHECPKCKVEAVRRKASGIWTCKHCGAEFASGSYLITPPVAVRRELAEVLAKVESKEAAAEEELIENLKEKAEEELDREEEIPKKHKKGEKG